MIPSRSPSPCACPCPSHLIPLPPLQRIINNSLLDPTPDMYTLLNSTLQTTKPELRNAGPPPKPFTPSEGQLVNVSYVHRYVSPLWAFAGIFSSQGLVQCVSCVLHFKYCACGLYFIHRFVRYLLQIGLHEPI